MLSEEQAGQVQQLFADYAATTVELVRLRAAVATLAGACRHASSEIRRAAAFPSSLYGLGSIADTLDAALAAAEPRPAGDATAANRGGA